MSNIFACNCSYEKNVIVRSNREYDYFGNVLEYEYDYFHSNSSTSTQKVLVLEYEYKYTSTITPSLTSAHLEVSKKPPSDTFQKPALAHARNLPHMLSRNFGFRFTVGLAIN